MKLQLSDSVRQQNLNLVRLSTRLIVEDDYVTPFHASTLAHDEALKAYMIDLPAH